MRAVGRAFRQAGVVEVYLAHGTFVGSDAMGILGQLGRLYPAAGEFLRRLSKEVVDTAIGEGGNYTDRYASTFEEAIQEEGAPHIAVRRFHWSSQNNHIGRADGAIRLIDTLASLPQKPGSRVLLWGHSHAGNVFSLLTNLLAADAATLERFFHSASIYYRWPLLGCIDIPIWCRARLLLENHRRRLKSVALDLVTFGTPIRYGWDSAGYSRLLHFVNHRPSEGLPAYRAPFPPKPERVLTAADGDYVQQLGIAGTNIAPSIFSWRSRLADSRLNDLLQSGVRRRDLFEHFRAGVRVPEEGTTLLVDYGPAEGNIAQHVAGHAIYTRRCWLLFHAEEVVRRFY